MPRPLLALRFGRIVNARLGAEAADLLEKAYRQHNAWRGTHIRSVPRRHAIFQTLRCFIVLDEQTTEPQTRDHWAIRCHPDAPLRSCANQL
jgi:hypothetical protein